MLKSLLAAKPFQSAQSELPAQIQNLADKQVIVDVMSTQKNDAGITVINPGTVSNFKKIAPKFPVTIENTDDEGQVVYAFNVDTYKANAGAVTLSVSDGFSGKLVNKLAADKDGLLIYGFNVTGYDADGVPSDEVINNLAMELRSYIGYGDSYNPTPIDIAGSERNTQYKTGVYTVRSQFVLNCLSQIKATLAAGCKVNFVFFTTPIVG